jgi:hypothetical protein
VVDGAADEPVVSPVEFFSLLPQATRLAVARRAAARARRG